MTTPNIPQNPDQNPAHQDNIFVAAYHGLMATMAERRMNRAASIMERMDHKEALYADLAHMAVTNTIRIPGEEADRRRDLYAAAEQAVAPGEGRMPRHINREEALDPSGREFLAAPTATDVPAKPRSFAERWIDGRIQKRDHKREIAEIYQRRNEKIYGTSDMSALEGTTKWAKRAEKVGVSIQRHTGNLTYQEARIQKNNIAAEPPKLGKEPVKWSNKQVRKTTRRSQHSMDQPILSRWRNMRHRRAVNRIQSNYKRMQRHY